MLKAIRNSIANFVGGLTTMGAILVFNALYFRIVTEEEFGIISLLLTTIFLVPGLDLGIGRTAGRILAKDLAVEREAAGLRDAVATLQLTNLAIGLGLGAGLALAAPAISTGWLKPTSISHTEVAGSVALIGANVALMMPRNFVTACLNGMKRQVLANILLTSFTLLRGIAGLIALLVSDGSLHTFFIYQLAVQALDTVVSSAVLWWYLPAADRRPRIDPNVVRSSWRFAAGDGATALIGVCMAQGDKLLLSTLLPLSSYGTYALVSTVAGGIGRITSPFSAAFLPHYVELTALGRKSELRDDYLVSTQLLSCVILPLAAIMIAFAPEIVAEVLGADRSPEQLPLVFALLVAATILNNLLHLPHGVQLAAGNSTTALRFAAVNSALYIALIVITTKSIGVLGPAISLFTIHAVTFFLFARLTGRMLGLGMAFWAGHSILRPGLAAIATVVLAKLVTPGGLGLSVGAAWLVAVMLAGLTAALVVSPGARRALRTFGRQFRSGSGIS